MSGKPGRCGRKSFVATPEQRNNVKILVGLGVPAGDDLPVGGEPADRQTMILPDRRVHVLPCMA
jgi:hypothetical protein